MHSVLSVSSKWPIIRTVQNVHSALRLNNLYTSAYCSIIYPRRTFTYRASLLLSPKLILVASKGGILTNTQLMEVDMSRFTQLTKRELFSLWIRQYILGINIINIIGGLLTQNQQGFVGIMLVIPGILAVANAFNKKLNITFLDKGHAILNFIVGMITTYIGAMLIYSTIIGG